MPLVLAMILGTAVAAQPVLVSGGSIVQYPYGVKSRLAAELGVEDRLGPTLRVEGGGRFLFPEGAGLGVGADFYGTLSAAPQVGHWRPSVSLELGVTTASHSRWYVANRAEGNYYLTYRQADPLFVTFTAAPRGSDDPPLRPRRCPFITAARHTVLNRQDAKTAKKPTLGRSAIEARVRVNLDRRTDDRVVHLSTSTPGSCIPNIGVAYPSGGTGRSCAKGVRG